MNNIRHAIEKSGAEIDIVSTNEEKENKDKDKSELINKSENIACPLKIQKIEKCLVVARSSFLPFHLALGISNSFNNFGCFGHPEHTA